MMGTGKVEYIYLNKAFLLENKVFNKQQCSVFGGFLLYPEKNYQLSKTAILKHLYLLLI